MSQVTVFDERFDHAGMMVEGFLNGDISTGPIIVSKNIIPGGSMIEGK